MFSVHDFSYYVIPFRALHDRKNVSRSIGGEVEFSFFHRWFDVIFVLSACASIVSFMITNALQASYSVACYF